MKCLKKYANWILPTVLVGVVACAGGSKRPTFKDFPKRGKEFTFWSECSDSFAHVCKPECHRWGKKNECKERFEAKMNIKEALSEGFIMIHKTQYFQLLKGNAR